jgi:hypothetical protein
VAEAVLRKTLAPGNWHPRARDNSSVLNVVRINLSRMRAACAMLAWRVYVDQRRATADILERLADEERVFAVKSYLWQWRRLAGRRRGQRDVLSRARCIRRWHRRATVRQAAQMQRGGSHRVTGAWVCQELRALREASARVALRTAARRVKQAWWAWRSRWLLAAVENKGDQLAAMYQRASPLLAAIRQWRTWTM